MDAFAVSISSGTCLRRIGPLRGLRAAFFFGAFQFAMPVAGWFLGNLVRGYIGRYDHFVAFVLLGFIGGKMIFEAIGGLKDKKQGVKAYCETNEKPRGILKMGPLLVLAVATSLDALAVGLSYSVLNEPIWFLAVLTGFITMGLSLAGLRFGQRLGLAFGEWAELLGGFALVAIGTRILSLHLLRGI